MEAKIGNARGSRTLNGILWILSVLSGTMLGIAGSFAVAVSAMSDYRQMYNQWIGTDTEITSKEAQENLAWIENSPWVVYFADENAQSDLLSWLLLALVALAIVFCAALIILCVQTGRLGRADDGSIQLNRFDRVWSEVLLLLGGGAAGGMGAGMSAFFGASLRSGIDIVLDTVRFDRMLQTADWVFTGEGRLDSQSLRGKVVIGVAQRAKAAGIPVIAVVGDAEDNLDGAYEAGVTAVFPINRRARSFQEIRHLSRSFLAQTAGDILRLIARAEQLRSEPSK